MKMRKMLLAVAFAAVVFCAGGVARGNTAKAEPKVKIDYSKMQIVGKTNKSPLSYKVGEEMIYTFKLDAGGENADGLFLRWTRKGDDGIQQSGKVPANQELVVKTSLNKAGFVSVNVDVVDEKGKQIRFYRNNSKRSRTIAYFAGTAVEPETLTDCGEPADFDAFWVKQRKRLDAVPFQGKVERKKVGSLKNGVEVYAVSIPCAGPRPATGYLTIPAGAKAKSLPAMISFFGYSSSRQLPPKSASSQLIQLQLNAHGQELGREDAYYDKFFKDIRSNDKAYAFDPIQNSNPETAFFNGMALRIMRALEYLKSLPEWDGKNLQASGGSQGGLQTMWAAALDQDVTYAAPRITWCCDLAGTEKKQRLSGGWRIKYVPALDYYDPVFMAKRIKNATVVITRAGLGDYVCPPSGLAISYNNIASPNKSIRWVQGSDHGFVPKGSDVVVWSTMEPEK